MEIGLNTGEQSIRTRLVIGFSLIFAVITIIWVAFTLQAGTELSRHMANRDSVQKMLVIAELVEAARSRTRLTSELMMTEDIFERDGITLQLDQLATQFSFLRNQLSQLSLSENDRTRLTELNVVIPRILIRQRQAVELAMFNDPEENRVSREILLREVLPGQKVIIDHFMAMLNETNAEVSDNVRLARQSSKRYGLAALSLYATGAGLILLIAVITIRHASASEKTLQRERQLARATLMSIGDATIIIDENGRIADANQAARHLLRNDSLKGRMIDATLPLELVGEDQGDFHVATFLAGRGESRQICGAILFPGTPHYRYIDIGLSPIADGKVRFGHVLSIHDVTEQTEAGKRLEFEAGHDNLTGLLNRRSFEREFEKVRHQTDAGTSHSICLIDLDRFKVVNDTAGHPAGDQLLIQLSALIGRKLRSQDKLARIGGDEFLVLLTDCTGEDAVRVMEGVVTAINDYHFMYEQKLFTVGASIGVLEICGRDEDFSVIFNTVDTACYLAKDEGRNSVRMIEIERNGEENHSDGINWVEKVRQAINDASLILEFQPIVALNENLGGMAEVLVRMRDENRIILPGAFLPTAERYDMIGEIDLFVLGKVIQLLHNRPLDCTFCINLSSRTINNEATVQRLLEAVIQAPITPEALCFEISETTAISHLDSSARFLQRARAIGCKTALDDFGTGLGAFNQLEGLEIDYLKIDGSVIQRLNRTSHSNEVVSSIIRISRTMGITTIAEYVDSDEILESIKLMEVDYVQGFLVGRPQSLYYI